MPNVAACTTISFSDEVYPLKYARVEVVLETDVEMPEPAIRRCVSDALTTAAHNYTFELVELEEGESTPGEISERAKAWRVPDELHMKSVKAAHRFLKAVAALNERGPAATLDEAAEEAKLSMPPVYRFVNPEYKVGAYLAPLIEVSKRDRVKVVDLTPLGRHVASRIRAGSLPS